MGFLLPALCLQARWKARGVRQRGGGDGRGEEDGGIWHLVRKAQSKARHRKLRAALKHPPWDHSPHPPPPLSSPRPRLPQISP